MTPWWLLKQRPGQHGQPRYQDWLTFQWFFLLARGEA